MADERSPEGGTPATPPDDTENGGTPDAGDDTETETVEELREKLRSERELALVHKSKAERVNAVEAENARLKALVEARTTTDTRDAGVDEDEEYLRQIAAAAQGKDGDKASKAFMAGIRRAEALVNEARAEREMAKIPEADVPAVEKLMREKGVKSPAIAYQFIRGEKYGSLEQEVAALRAQLADKGKPTPNVERPIRGDSRAAPSKLVNGKEVITLQEYHERMNDPARRGETKNARDCGKLTIKAQ